jgi:hypothetical protein
MTAQASAAVASVHLIGKVPLRLIVAADMGPHGWHDNGRELCLQHSYLGQTPPVRQSWCGSCGAAVVRLYCDGFVAIR